MEILYGIIILLAFILGLGMGLSVPFFVKKYVETLKTPKEVDSIVEKKYESEKIRYIPNDLMKEYLTGEEVKPNEEQ